MHIQGYSKVLMEHLPTCSLTVRAEEHARLKLWRAVDPAGSMLGPWVTCWTLRARKSCELLVRLLAFGMDCPVGPAGCFGLASLTLLAAPWWLGRHCVRARGEPANRGPLGRGAWMPPATCTQNG